MHVSKKFNESPWKTSHFFNASKKLTLRTMFMTGIMNEKKQSSESKIYATTNLVCLKKEYGSELGQQEEERQQAELMNLISNYSTYISRV